MKRIVIILFIVSIARGDVYTSHQLPLTDSTLDIGSATYLWRKFYGDSFTDGTALWNLNSLTGFTSISSVTFTDTVLSITEGSISSAIDGTFTGTLTGYTLTDGVFIATGGVVTAGTWQATAIDISDYTNLVAGTNITLADDTLNVDDVFLRNDGDDTTTGTITAAGFTTTGAVTAGASTFGDGGINNYTEFNDDGVMSMYGDARVERHINIGAASFKRGASAPTETYENIFPTLTFADGADDAAHYTTWVPYQWDNTTDMEVHVHWQHDDVAKTGKVLWNLNYIGAKEGEDPAGAGTLISQLSAGDHPQDEIIDTIFSTKILAANLERMDDLGLKLWRNGDDGTDTLTEGAELISMHIHYNMNQLGDPYDFLLLETGDFLLLETGDKLILEGV